MAKKLYYKIGEACKKLEIQPYVLRYWETEFPFLKPNKSKSGQRVYSDLEIGIIRRIKELLYEEGYTIAGAKKKLESELQASENGVESAASAKKAAPAKTTPPGGKKAGDKAAGGKTTGGKTAGGKTASSKSQPAAQSMDADAAQQIEKLRLGVEVALRQTREILDAL
ncbi:MAG: MerR family transcriptional regulator [Acidobacteriota bacterium]